MTALLQPLGLSVARWYINQGAKTVILLDETEMTPKIKAEIEELKNLNCKIVVHKTELNNKSNLEYIFESIKNDLPPLKGIIHSAGILHDDLLMHTDWKGSNSVSRLKISGSWYLHEISQQFRLDHFILFSTSLKDLVPTGKTSLSIGNAFLNALSHYRQKIGLPSLSIDWPPWELKKMIIEHLSDNTLEDVMELLNVDKGLELLSNLVSYKKPQIVAANVHWEVFFKKAIFENPFFNEIKKEFEAKSEEREIIAAQSTSNEPIAIIGMACQFPGAKNYREFWENLINQVDSVKEIPSDRWDWKAFYGDPKTEPGKTNVKWGGFVDGIDKFDPFFFNISPKEAAYIDPQHRIFLQTVWHAIEDAGYASSLIAGKKIVVYAGVSKNDYTELMRENHVEIAPYVSTGTVHSILTNRVSYFLDLHGPSESVDTACSSSLVALHAAMTDIRNGECKLAIVGGVNALLSPTMYLSHTRSGMLSDDGHCKTFDESANGYVRAEGVGAILLKPLKEAIKDGDNIHAVVRGAAVNHGGKSTGLTAPNPRAQAEVVQIALKEANIDPDTVTCIEVHGTGTPLGDPIEIQGLKEAFADRENENECILCAVKTNIGHLESAAGIAGIIKMILQLKYGTIPGIIHFKSLNSRITLEESPFSIATSTMDWKPVDKYNKQIVKRGGVSSFGMGGTNGHVILEESPTSPPIKTKFSEQLFPLSAQKGRLKAYVESLIEYLNWATEKNIPVDLDSLAYTLQTGRDVFEERVIFAADSVEILIERLKHFLNGKLENHVPLSKSAKKWMDGENVDWNNEWKEKPLRLGGAPVYPFRPTRCWFELQEKAIPEVTRSFKERLDPNQPFLRDHIVAGKSILPGVMYLEIARKAPEKSATAIRNVNWISPIKAKNEPFEISINLDQGLHQFEISQDESIKCTGELYYDKINSIPDRVDIEKVIESCPHKMSQTEIYEKMQTFGLKQGPSLLVLTDFYSNQNSAIGRLKLTPSENLNDFLLHPSLMDGVFQTVVAHHFCEHKEDMRQYLPYALESVEWYRPLEKEVYAYVEELKGSGAGNLLKYDMKMLNENGDVLVLFKGFSRRPIKQSSPVPIKDLYYTDRWVESLPEKNRQMSEHLLLFSTDNALKEALSAKLPEVKIISIGTGSHFEMYSEEHYVINPSVIDDFHKLITDLKERGIQIQEIIFAWDSFDLVPVLFLTQAVIKSRNFRELLLLYVYSSPEDLIDSQYAMAAGFGRTLIYENPKMELRSIETDRIGVNEQAEIIVKELQTKNRGPLLEVSYKGEIRKLREVIPSPEIERHPPQKAPFKENGIYLISGGTGGLGQIFAKFLAENYHANLILLGRSEINESVQKALKALKESAASVHYLSADITDLQALKKAFGTLPKELQHLNGVIHGAGLKQDSFILKKEEESFNSVIRTKVKGALNLDVLTQDMNLDFMVLFSSIASLIPNQGQSDYAAANSFLDHFALMRNKKRSGVTLAINWPLWASGGMRVTAEQEEHLKHEFGMDPLPTELGIQAFTQLISYAKESKIDQVVVISGDKSKIMKAFGGISVKQIHNTYPLIDSIQKEGAEAVILKEFSADFPFVNGFSHKGKPAVPGACFLEMARQAAEKVYNEKGYVCVKNNYWPIPLEIEGEKITTFTHLTQHLDQVDFEISTQNSGGEPIVHATGTLATNHLFPIKPEVIDLQKKLETADQVIDSHTFYETIHTHADLRLAGSFRPVQQLYVFDMEAVARLTLPKGTPKGNFLIQPMIFTGLEQSLLVYTALTHQKFHPAGMRLMPVSIESVDIYAPFPESCMIHILAKKEPSERNKIQRFDISLYDESGAIVAFISGNTMRISPTEKTIETAVIPPSVKSENAEKYIKKILSKVLGMQSDEIDPSIDFEKYGVTSQMIVELNSLIEKDLGPIPKTLFFEYANVNELANYLNEQYEGKFSSETETPIKATVNTGASENAEKYIKRILSQVLGMQSDEIDSSIDFEKYGVTSQMIVELNTLMEKDLGPIPKTLFFEYANVNELANHLNEQYTDKFSSSKATSKVKDEEVVVSKKPTDTDIAIIGMSGRFPDAANIDQYWDNLKNGKDSISKNPLHQDLYRSDLIEEEILSCKWGGSIEDVDSFDPEFFGIAPNEGALIDPQERLFLKVAWEALQDAGWDPKEMDSSERNICVFVGAIWQDYQLIALEESLKGNPVAVSSLLYSLANRVSYTFNLTGTSLTVDTACSSSLTALHLACQSLIAGEAQAAIVGGINLNIHPMKYAFLNNYDFLSTEGKCRSYGEGGDGYVPGEGVGALILKPLSEAIKDGDPVHAVIKGSSTNHGGKTRGYTVPNPTLQSEVILRAIEKSHINPREISYVEGHGTGTALGDPVEIRGLDLAYKKYTPDKQYCSIGSVKSNIGHLEAAAGIASIIKVILQMQHKTLVPSLHSETLNSNIDFSNTPFYVQHKLEPWVSDQPLLAAVSSFGAGGSYAHVILEESKTPTEFENKRKHSTAHLQNESKYWIEASAPPIHPLNRELNLSTLPYLKDHQVYETIIFPGAGYLEMMLAAERDKILTNVSFEAPLQLDSNNPSLIRIEKDKGKIAINSKPEEGSWTRHAKCSINDSFARETLSPLNFKSIQKRCKKLQTKEEFYSFILKAGMNLGNYFQTIESINLGKREAFAEIKLSLPSSGYYAHPALLDGCIQLLAMSPWLKEAPELYLPVGCDQVIFYAPLKEHIFVHCETLESTETARSGNLTLCSPTGEVLMILKGMRYRKTTETGFKQLLAQETPISDLLYEWSLKKYEFKDVKVPEPIGHWLVFTDDFATEELLSKFTARDGTFRTIAPAEQPTSKEGFVELLESEPFSGILHLSGSKNEEELTVEKIREDQTIATKSFLHLTQALIELQDKIKIPLNLIIANTPEYSPLTGFFKTVRLEQPELKIKLIELNETFSPKLLFQAIFDDTEEAIYSIDESNCYVPRFQRTPFENLPSEINLSQKASYLITGGYGGVGQKVAKWLIEQGAGSVILAGRKKQEDLQPNITYVKLDVSDEKSVAKVLNRLKKGKKPLKGIFHLAGLLDDATLMNQDWSRFEKVFAPKVYGSYYLHKHAKNIDYFVTFSSITSTLGNPGQSNYAAANAFMDSLCSYRRQQGLPALSVSWGPWGEVGMAAKIDNPGWTHLNTNEALKSLSHAMQQQKNISVIRIEWEKYLSSLASSPSWLIPFQSKKSEESKHQSTLNSLTPTNNIQSIKTFISDSIREVLGIPEERTIDEKKSFFDMGLNSLMAIQLKNRIQSETGEIGSTAVFDHPSIEKMTEYLMRLLKVEEKPKEELREVRPKDLYHEADLSQEIQIPKKKPNKPPQKIFFTGVTGGLGSHLLHQSALQFESAVLYCLVRAKSTEEGYQRIIETMRNRGIDPSSFEERIQPILGDLSLSLLGIEKDKHQMLCEKIDLIFHCGAQTNWSYSYEMLKPANVGGSYEVIKLATTEVLKPIHHISTMAIFPFYKDKKYSSISEDLDILHDAPLILPYYQSKWVSEMQMQHAREGGVEVNVYRPGSLICDLHNGVPVSDELSYRMVEGCRQLGYAPDIDFDLSLTPLDIAAEIIVSIAANDKTLGHNYNIVNPNRVVIKNLISKLCNLGHPIDFIPFESWIEKTKKLDVTTDQNPVIPVLDVLIDLIKNEETTKLTTNTVKAIEGTDINFPVSSEKIIDAYIKGMTQGL